MSKEQNLGVKKFYQNSSKPRNYVPSALVTSPPEYPPVMSGLMQINPETKDIWISAGKEFVSDWINVAGGGGGGNIAVQFNGTPISTAATTLNFVGTNITSVTGDPLVTITVPQVPLIFKNTAPGIEVKNTLVPGITYSQLIPKNTITPGSIIRISYRIRKTPFANTAPARLVVQLGQTYFTSSVVAVADMDWTIANQFAYGQLKREIAVDSATGTTKWLSNKATSFNDTIDAIDEDIVSIDWTLDQTFFFIIQHLSSTTDAAAGSFYSIEIY